MSVHNRVDIDLGQRGTSALLDVLIRAGLILALAMHQQLRATEQPLALKIASKSCQRSGVRGATVSFIEIASRA